MIKRKPIYNSIRNFLGRKDLCVSLYTNACRYKCGFCSLSTRSESIGSVTAEEIYDQIDQLLLDYSADLDTIEQLSIGNEGSILDESTFPWPSMKHLISKFSPMPKLRIISFETRVEFLKKKSLLDIMRIANGVQIEITTGYETHNEHIRNKILKKGLSDSVFEEKLDMLSELGIWLTCYIMLKPSPYMTEEEGIKECIDSLRYLSRLSTRKNIHTTIYLNPTYISRGSEIDKIAKKTNFKPPSLWSIIKVIKECKKIGLPIYTGLSSEGLATDYGESKNCENCSARVKRAISKFNKTQDHAIFKGLSCPCQARSRLMLN